MNNIKFTNFAQQVYIQETHKDFKIDNLYTKEYVEWLEKHFNCSDDGK